MNISKNKELAKAYLKDVYRRLPLSSKAILGDIYYDALAYLSDGNFQQAYVYAKRLHQSVGHPLDELNKIFDVFLKAEDVLKSGSSILIHEQSPYAQSLKEIGKAQGISVVTHTMSSSFWTKDYTISLGARVITPIIQPHEEAFTEAFVESVKLNPNLYYGSLGLDEHHHSKSTISDPNLWLRRSHSVLGQTKLTTQVILEGGNVFCAINRLGQRYFLVGENVISETMAVNDLSREDARELVESELGVPSDRLLVIPQWTYHLDLQMSYLGKGQFIIHSFEQSNFDFGLSEEDTAKVETTFVHLKKQFEKSIIDKACEILREHHFEAHKVFGCLFYLNDCSNLDELQYVPYCKNSDSFGGAIALLMNGVAFEKAENERFFITSRCDQDAFKQSFVKSINSLGIDALLEVDMLGCYGWDGEFEPLLAGIWGATSVTDVVANMNGGFRCQTSIISNQLIPSKSPELFERDRIERLSPPVPLLKSKSQRSIFKPIDIPNSDVDNVSQAKVAIIKPIVQ